MNMGSVRYKLYCKLLHFCIAGDDSLQDKLEKKLLGKLRLIV